MKLRAVNIYTSKTSGKTYTRHDVTIPAEALEELGWPTGCELDWEIDEGRLILKKTRSTKKKS